MGEKEKKSKISGTITFIDADGHPLDEAGLNKLSKNLINAILNKIEPEDDELVQER